MVLATPDVIPEDSRTLEALVAGVDGLFDPPVTNATVKQRTRAILLREGSPTVAAVDLVGHALHQWRVLKPASTADNTSAVVAFFR